MSQAFENLITKIDNRYSSFVEFEEFDYNEKLVEEVYFMLYWLDNHGIDLSKYESNNLEDSDGRFLGIEYSTEWMIEIGCILKYCLMKKILSWMNLFYVCFI